MARHPLALAGTYRSQSPNASADFTMNWYPEIIETGAGKSNLVLYPTPGLKLFVALTGASVRGIFSINNRTFAVAGTTLWEILGNGTSVNRGTVANDGLPASKNRRSRRVELRLVWCSSRLDICFRFGGKLLLLRSL